MTASTKKVNLKKFTDAEIAKIAKDVQIALENSTTENLQKFRAAAVSAGKLRALAQIDAVLATRK